MKLFLTGGTGFIGSHFINQAIAAGHDIVALRRTGSKNRIPLEKEPIWIDGELDGDYRKHLKGSNTLVHLASHTPNPPYDTLENCLKWNVIASIKLARQAHEAGINQFIVAGSCFEYGTSCLRYDYLSPDTPLEPSLSYPTSKAAASIAFQGLARELGFKLKVLRIFQVYGEGESENRLWPSLKRAALAGEDFPMSNGEQIRDFIHVSEVGRQLIEQLDFENVSIGTPFTDHIATGEPKTLLEFSKYWWEHWNAKGKIIPGVIPYRHNEMMRIVTRK